MSTRARQSHRLAADLAEHFGVRVELVYTGERDRNGNGAWQVSWNDGPTPATMRAEIARHAARYPAVDVERLGFSRSSTDLAQAAALLAWLPQHPEWCDHLDNTFVVDRAFNETEFPEQLDEQVLRQARSLLRQGEGWLSGPTIRLLGEQCARGWEQAEQWLDGMAAQGEGRADDNVIDLAAARERHQT